MYMKPEILSVGMLERDVSVQPPLHIIMPRTTKELILSAYQVSSGLNLPNRMGGTKCLTKFRMIE